MKDERHQIMNFSLFKSIVDDLVTFEDRLLRINLHGFGEPLLNENLCSMIKYLNDMNICDDIRLVSNGVALTHELSEHLINSGLTELKISLNGLNSSDYLKHCGREIDYEHFYENLCYFSEISQKKTALVIKATSHFITSAEKEVTLQNMYGCIADKVMIDDIHDIWIDYDSATTATLNPQNYNMNRYDKKICSLPFTTMAIHSNGKVSPCCVDWKFSLVSGDKNKESLHKIWNSEKLRAHQLALLTKQLSTYPSCLKCVCSGTCNIDANAMRITKKLTECYGRKDV